MEYEILDLEGFDTLVLANLLLWAIFGSEQDGMRNYVPPRSARNSFLCNICFLC